MKSNYSRCLDEVLRYEGGYVNHPSDPGGATNMGVTQKTYDAWRRKQGAPTQSVRHIARAEVEAIYAQEYWSKVRGDELPRGVDLAVFDFAVNSGVSRSAKYTQALVGTAQDGIIGPQTLAAIEDYDGKLNLDLCDRRMKFLKGLSTWPTFGKGWTNRVNSVRAVSEDMRKSAPQEPTETTPTSPSMSQFESDLLIALENPTIQMKIIEIIGNAEWS